MDWDPLVQTSTSDEAALTPQCSYRLKRDIKSILDDPLDGILIEPDESDFLRVHVLLTGSPNTPYDKGFFYFLLGFPCNYPFKPPKVRLMTTSAGKVRFNPNLYASGKVCLSILGTYFGPEWSAAQGLRSVLLSIQSLMNEKPYHNEPGCEQEKSPGDAEKYNTMIRYDTLKVAVLEMVGSSHPPNMPKSFQNHVAQAFIDNYTFYEQYILDNVHLTGSVIEDPLYHYEKGVFQYDRLLDKLESAKSAVEKSLSKVDTSGLFSDTSLQ